MRKKIFRYVAYFAFIFFSLFVHLFFKSFFPPPVNYINFLLLTMVFLSVFYRNSPLYQLLLIPIFFLEPFSSYAYGVHAGAIILSCLFVKWCVRTFFTNNSFFTIITTSMLAVLCFRLFLFIEVSIENFLLLENLSFSNDILAQLLYEILANTLFITLAYGSYLALAKVVKPYKKVNQTL